MDYIIIILQKYRDATVRKKDGVLLTRDIAAEMKNLMDMKKNAILVLMSSINTMYLHFFYSSYTQIYVPYSCSLF